MVSPGTTVRWKWTGRGGTHNVVAEGGAFDSGTPAADGETTFEHTFEETGVYEYVCTPHSTLGMKGAVVVREGSAGGATATASGEGDGSATETSTGDGGSGGDNGTTPTLDGWFDGVSNFDGVADRTGQGAVTVDVGAEGNGGNVAFGPAAVMVSPGTTVRWKWTGEGATHNVVAEGGTFDSGTPVAEAGTTFEYTFEEPGTYRYVCTPHQSLGMRGAVVVTDAPDGGGADAGGAAAGPAMSPGVTAVGGSLVLAFASPLFLAVGMRALEEDGSGD